MRRKSKAFGRARRPAFVQAQQDRWVDARTLLEGKRWGGTIYLAGYVVECLLKARILKRYGLTALPPEYWHHDLERLVDSAGLRTELAQPRSAEILQLLTLLYGLWDVTMRYGGARFRREDAESALAAVEVIRLWLLARI